MILVIACVATPLNIAFGYINTSMASVIGNYCLDFMFLFDIIVNFNSAFVAPTFELVEDRGAICKAYIKGWFTVDLLAIIPIDLIISSGADASGDGTDISSFAKVARFGRLYKLAKLTKLLRILKTMKEDSKLRELFNSMGTGL